MKKNARSLVISLIAFLIVAYYYPGFEYGANLGVLMVSGAVFSVLTIFVKPVINLLSLPFNLLTFGFFSFAINILILFGVSYLIPAFKIVGFNYPGFTYSGFVIPSWDLTQLVSALVASFLIGLISTVLFWIFR
jgi:putative membrane protein